MNWKKPLWLIVRLVLFVLAFWYIFDWVDLSKLKELWNGVNYFGLIMAFVAVLVSHSARGLRLKTVLNAIKQHVSFRKSFAVFAITTFWGRITPAKVGDFGKVGFFKDKKKLFPYLILERVFDILAVAIIGCPLAYLLHPKLPWAILVGAIIFVLLCTHKPFLRFVKKWMSKVIALPKTSSGVLLLKLAVLSLGSWVASLLALYFVALATGVFIEPHIFLACAAAAVVVGIVSGTPGGFGTREATLAYLLYLTTGLDLATGTTIAIYAIIVVTLSEFVLFLVGNILERKS